MAYPPVWFRASKGSNIDRLRAELAAEFRDALLHAYHGPHVDMSARQLPTAFEADERTDPTSPDILQLLSGRCNQWDAPVWQSPRDRPSLQLALEHTAGTACRACLCEGARAARQAAAGGCPGEERQPAAGQRSAYCAGSVSSCSTAAAWQPSSGRRAASRPTRKQQQHRRKVLCMLWCPMRMCRPVRSACCSSLVHLAASPDTHLSNAHLLASQAGSCLPQQTDAWPAGAGAAPWRR